MAIELSDITLCFGEKALFNRVSLSLPDKGTVCFFGPSGCGKTTMLRLIAGLQKPDSGRITGTDGLRIAAVFQEPRLLPWLTAYENVACIAENSDDAAKNLLMRLGFSAEDVKKYPDELSGGMKQRVSIARAILYDGDLLLLDEPFTGLDQANILTAKEMLDGGRERLTLLVTHDREQAEQCDKIIEFPL